MGIDQVCKDSPAFGHIRNREDSNSKYITDDQLIEAIFRSEAALDAHMRD